MFMPYASEYLVETATSAIDGACFSSDAEEQFLTILALESMSDYDGESDFGTLTRLDLDDEDRVVLTLVENIVAERTDLLSYAGVETLLGFGTDYKWWADWHVETPEDADRIQAEFATAYSEWLGCEDCGAPNGDLEGCICDSDETDG